MTAGWRWSGRAQGKVVVVLALLCALAVVPTRARAQAQSDSSSGAAAAPGEAAATVPTSQSDGLVCHTYRGRRHCYDPKGGSARPDAGAPPGSSATAGSTGEATATAGGGTHAVPPSTCGWVGGRWVCAPVPRPPWALPSPAVVQPPNVAPSAPPSEEGPAGMVGGETRSRGARTLDGHTFQFPRFVQSPFLATSFHVGAGVEFYDQSDVHSEFEVEPGQVESFTFDRDLVFARLRAALEVAPWEVASLQLEGQYLAQVGVNEQSLFLYGAETGYDVRPGLKFRLWRDDERASQLGLKIYGTFSGGLRAVPQGLLRELALEIADIAQDDERITCLVEADFACAFDDADLPSAIRLNRKRFGGGLGAAFAHAFSPLAGLQLSLGLEGAASSFSWRYLGNIDASSVLFHAGLSPSLNFYPDFPLALTAEYRFHVEYTNFKPDEQAGLSADATDTATGHRIAGGAYFTGRRDLMLGAIVGLSLLEESTEVGQSASDQPDALVVSLQFDMRYFF